MTLDEQIVAIRDSSADLRTHTVTHGGVTYTVEFSPRGTLEHVTPTTGVDNTYVITRLREEFL